MIKENNQSPTSFETDLEATTIPSNYETCEKMATNIAKSIHSKLRDKEELGKRCQIEYPDVERYQLNDVVLVLGLNPSFDEKTKIWEPRNLFGYVPEYDETEDDSPIRQKIPIKLVYPRYFKIFIEEFMKMNYNPLWFNKKYLEDLLAQYKNDNPTYNEIESFDEIIEYVSRFGKRDKKKYVVFADLIQYANTNSKDIKPYIKRENEKKEYREIADYIEYLIKFLKPKLVLSANAAVSDFLMDLYYKGINDRPALSSFDLFDTQFFTASMLSGGVMDKYSQVRLFREIKSFLDELNASEEIGMINRIKFKQSNFLNNNV